MSRVVAALVLLVAGALIGIVLTRDSDEPVLASSTDRSTSDTSGPRSDAERTPAAETAATADEVDENTVYPDVDLASVPQPPRLDKTTAPLTDLDGWLQSDISSLEELEGRVVIVQFWTYSCHNCKATIPYLQALYERYESEGLEIVGVHSPEFEFEKDPDAIAQAAVELGVTWPIALDTDRVNFKAWQGSPAYWPRTYVLDQQGRVRYNNIGEGAYDQLAETVAWLLAH